MAQRLSYATVAPGALRPMYDASRYLLTSSTLGAPLLQLVYLRVSQMNGCAFCIAMHWREAKEGGRSDDHLHGLPAWREAGWYSVRERVALAWAEALTNLHDGHVPDDLFLEAKKEFEERELVDLTLAVTTINAWNRFAIAFRTPPETAESVIAAMKSKE